MLKAVTKKNLFKWNPLNFPHCVYVHDFVSKNSLTLENVLSVRNIENEIESYKLSQTPVRFQKNPTQFLLAKWVIKSFSFCSPQIKLLSFVSGGVAICNPAGTCTCTGVYGNFLDL